LDGRFRDLSIAIETLPLASTGADEAKKDVKKKKKADSASTKDAVGGPAIATSIRFQLQRNPENLARPIGQVDSRVQFRPDDWQVYQDPATQNTFLASAPRHAACIC
jgi:hypothetical protein